MPGYLSRPLTWLFVPDRRAVPSTAESIDRRRTTSPTILPTRETSTSLIILIIPICILVATLLIAITQRARAGKMGLADALFRH